MLTLNQKDALKARVLQPGWRICEVENHYIKPAAGDGSNVHYYEITVIAGDDKNTPLSEFIVSEKAVGMGKAFFIACGQPESDWQRAEKGEAVSFDEKLPVGRKIKVFVKPEPFNNRLMNRATDFMRLTESEIAALGV